MKSLSSSTGILLPDRITFICFCVTVVFTAPGTLFALLLCAARSGFSGDKLSMIVQTRVAPDDKRIRRGDKVSVVLICKTGIVDGIVPLPLTVLGISSTSTLTIVMFDGMALFSL